MKSKTNVKLQFAIALLASTLAIAGSATAQSLPKEGTYDYNTCYSGTRTPISLGKDNSAFIYEFMGTTTSNPPGGYLDKTSFRCVGMRTSFGGKTASSSTCVTVDNDGDKRLTYFATGRDGKRVKELVLGTGKYEGAIEKGSVSGLGSFPSIKEGTFQNCLHQTGTYKLK